MPMQLFSPLPHTPLSHSRQNHIPVSHLPRQLKLILFIDHLYSDHPLKLSSPHQTPVADRHLYQTILSMFKVLQNVMTLFRSWRVGPCYSFMTPAITQTLHIIFYHRPQALWRHSSHDAPLQHSVFLYFNMHLTRCGPLPVHLTFTSKWQSISSVYLSTYTQPYAYTTHMHSIQTF